MFVEGNLLLIAFFEKKKKKKKKIFSYYCYYYYFSFENRFLQVLLFENWIERRVDLLELFVQVG